MRGNSCARPQAACRPFGRRALRTRAQAQVATTAAQRRRLVPTLHQKRTPAVEPPPGRRGLRRLCAAAVARGLRPPFRLFPRTIRPLTAYWAVNIADGSRKFARKLACPPDFVRGTWMRFGELSSLLILGSSGRRLRTRACLSVERAGLRRALPAPAKEPPFAAAPSDVGHFLSHGRRKPLPQWRSTVVSRQPYNRNAPQQSSRHLGGADRVAYARQHLRAASGRRSGCFREPSAR